MKKLFLSSLLLLLFGACSNTNIDSQNKQIDHEVESTETAINEDIEETKDSEVEVFEEDTNDNSHFTDDIQNLHEFSTLNEVINLTNSEINIVENNPGKRIIIISNEKGHKTHKSIFIKHSNRLKIIEFNKGNIFNQVI